MEPLHGRFGSVGRQSASKLVEAVLIDGGDWLESSVVRCTYRQVTKTSNGGRNLKSEYMGHGYSHGNRSFQSILRTPCRVRTYCVCLFAAGNNMGHDNWLRTAQGPKVMGSPATRGGRVWWATSSLAPDADIQASIARCRPSAPICSQAVEETRLSSVLEAKPPQEGSSTHRKGGDFPGFRTGTGWSSGMPLV